MKLRLNHLFLLLALGCLSAARGTEPLPPLYNAADLQGFIAKADALRLAERPYWRVLLHATRGWTGPVTSRVDAPGYFLAPNGKSDLAAELRADLTAFFRVPSATTEPNKTAVDRFPARLEWLCAELGVDRSRLPVPRALELELALNDFGAQKASMVFPTAYMNTPGSLFGHTLLKIKGQQTSELLARAVNYAAITTETNGLVFAVKGIFGGYPGYYSLQPYYQKVQEYSDLDQRDVWEYELKFTPAELRRMLLHIWELRDIYMDYYFFDENCALNLLYLLDAARPGLDLAGGVRPWVIPLDTVRQMQAAGLLGGCDYRASRTTRVRFIAGLLDGQRQEQARRLALGLTLPADLAAADTEVTGRVHTLDLAAEYLQSLRGRGKIPQADYQPRFFSILQARSKLGLPEVSKYQPPLPAQPDTGHASSRLALGIGSEGGHGFSELALRPAYHSLFDPMDGYVPGAQIGFMDVTVRLHEESDDRIVLQRFEMLNLQSLAPRDRFYQPLSWKAAVGVRRETMDHDDPYHEGYLDTGFGATWGRRGGALIYTLADGALTAGGPADGYALGLGASAGLLQPLGHDWLLDLHTRALGYPAGHRHQDVSFGGLLRYALTANQALTVELDRRFAFDAAATSAALKWHRFF